MRTNKQFKNTFSELNLVISVLPGYVYWKNIDSVYMGCSYEMTKILGLKNPKEIIGKLDYDFDWGKNKANEFKKEDIQIIKSKLAVISTQKLTIDKELRTYRTEKRPLIDKKGEVFGILGVATDITMELENKQLKIQNIEKQARIKADEVVIECLQELCYTIEKCKQRALDHKIGHIEQSETTKSGMVVLTKREREVIYLLSLNKAPKEIAMILSKIENKTIAASTISSIIDKKLYPKFGVNSISKVIKLANKLKLMPFILV